MIRYSLYNPTDKELQFLYDHEIDFDRYPPKWQGPARQIFRIMIEPGHIEFKSSTTAEELVILLFFADTLNEIPLRLFIEPELNF